MKLPKSKKQPPANESRPSGSHQRLVRRCPTYNAIHGTEYTPESYDEARTREPRLIAWDEGWESCETKLMGISAQFRKEATQLDAYAEPKAKGAAIAYRDMADKLDAMFPPPNTQASHGEQ